MAAAAVEGEGQEGVSESSPEIAAYAEGTVVVVKRGSGGDEVKGAEGYERAVEGPGSDGEAAGGGVATEANAEAEGGAGGGGDGSNGGINDEKDIRMIHSPP